MSLSFLLDEDISYSVAEGLRRRGVDAVSVHEIERANKRIADDDQLRHATEHNRVLVTYNRADFQTLDGEWRAREQSHAGILWCNETSIPRRAIGDLVRALEAMAQQHDTLQNLCLPLPRAPELQESTTDLGD